jgi:hypothetical protein
MDTTPESDAARDAVRERCADIARATIPSACSTSPPICPRCGTISPAGSSLAGALPCRIWPCNPSRPPWLPRWTSWWDAWPGAPLVADTERMMREAGLVDIWPFDGPTQTEGSTVERLRTFRTVRDQIERRIWAWLDTLEGI